MMMRRNSKSRVGTISKSRTVAAIAAIAVVITGIGAQSAAAFSSPTAQPSSGSAIAPMAAPMGGAGIIKPQRDPNTVWTEDFETAPAKTASRLGDYVSKDGTKYISAPGWMDYNQCNGVVTSYDAHLPIPSFPTGDYDWGIPTFPDGLCTLGGSTINGKAGNYPQLNVRRMADVLGQVHAGYVGGPNAAGVVNDSDATTQANHAVTAWTQQTGGSGPIMFESAQRLVLPQASESRYYTASVDVVEASCDYSQARNTNSKLRFLLILAGQPYPISANPIEACKSALATWYTSPMPANLPEMAKPGANPPTNWQNGGAALPAGTFYSDGSMFLTPAQLGDFKIRMTNDTLSGSGNDFSYDNITFADATPTINKHFGPAPDPVNSATFPQNGKTSLTFTIVNTTDNASKAGWSFTDAIPEGLSFVSPLSSTTTCTASGTPNSGTAAVTFDKDEAGRDRINVQGSLASGMSSCTVTTEVTGQKVGVFTNSDSNMKREGLLPSDPASVEVTPVVDLSIAKDVDLNWYTPGAGEAITYTVTVKNAASSATKAISTATGATVSDPIPANISGATWTCAAGEGATCAATGTGDIADTVTIPAGSQVVYTVTGTVNPAADGTITNTATVTPPPGTTDPECNPNCSAQAETLEGSIEIVKYINEVDADTLDAAPEVDHGSTMQVRFVVTNTGTIALNDVVVTDDVIENLGARANLGSMEPGTSKEFTVEWTAPDEGGKIHKNIGTATGTPTVPKTDGATPSPVTDTNPAFATTKYTPGIDLVKTIDSTDNNTSPGQEVDPGSDLVVTFLVKNTGNVTLNDVVVTDDLIPEADMPAECTVAELAPDASFTCQVTIQAPAEGGQIHENTGKAVGTPPRNDVTGAPPVPVEDTDPEFAHTVFDPSIIITKTIDGDDANESPGVLVEVGADMTVKFTVKNDGNVTLTNVTVTDNTITDLPAECSVASLKPGEEYSCTVVIKAPAEGGAVHTNIGSVEATPPVNELDPAAPQTPVTDEDPANAHTASAPGIEIVKTINEADESAEAPGVEVAPGSDMTVTLTVKNSGNVTLSTVGISDPTIGELPASCAVPTLAPGVSYSCEVTIPAPAEGGQLHQNTATVTGTPPQDESNPGVPPVPVTASDDAYAFVEYAPSIEVVKTINGDDANEAPGVLVEPGAEMTVQFTVKNTGNVTLTDVALVDDTIGALPAECSVATLAPGAEYVCAVTISAPAEGGSIHTNVAKVSGMPPQNALEPDVAPVPTTDDDPANAHTEYLPGIEITKTINEQDVNEAPGIEVAPGDDMTVEFTITNTGNVTLTDVSITDDKIADLPAECTVASLAPGATVTCSTTIKAPAEGGVVHTNVATASGMPPQNELTPDVPPTPVTSEDPANAFTTYTPGVQIVKTINGDDANEAPGVFVEPNSDMAIVFTVTNTGNVTLTNVTVTDDKITDLPASCTIATLAPGASFSCTVTVKTPGEGGQIHANTATVVASPPQNQATPDVPPVDVSDDDPAYAYTESGPAVQVVKTINGDDANESPGVEVQPGDDMVVAFTVTNVGNVTLTDVSVTDNTITDLPADCAIASLAPGESFTCTVTIKAPAEGGQIHANVATVTGTPPVDETDPGAPVVPITDEDPAYAHTTYEPGISIVKTLNGEDANAAPGLTIPAGSDMTFEYTVTNTGNVTLTNVSVTDDKIADLPDLCTVATLAPGETFTCTVTVKAPTADGTQYTNVGTATGTPPQNELTPDVPPTVITDTDTANAKVSADALPATGAPDVTLWGAAAALLLALGLGLVAARRTRQD